MAGRLAEKGIRPDVILASPAKRAAKTAAAVAKAIEFPKSAITWDERLYGADVGVLAEILWGIDESCTHAMLFGHNPGFTDLCNWVTRSFVDNIPTCGVAIIQLNVDRWKDVGSGSGEIMDFDYPKRTAE